ncbi:MAG: uracil-DNA glycosylase [Pseudomonadota bacterium]
MSDTPPPTAGDASDAIDPHVALAALLRWHSEMGVDEATAETPTDFKEFSAAALTKRSLAPAEPTPQPQTPRQPPPQSSPPAAPRSTRPQAARPVTAISGEKTIPADEAAADAANSAAACNDLSALAAAVATFEGCPLKAGARSTVFADGAENGDLLVIGEAPGREEDRIGRPFVGRAGQLLDRMLAAIGRSRETDTLISNVVFWRPPGNRTPTQSEVLICRPFTDRLIELYKPKAILLAGGAPTQALLGLSGIMRSRGRWRDLQTASGVSVPALPIFHPAFLLRQPVQKRLAWADLKSLADRLGD